MSKYLYEMSIEDICDVMTNTIDCISDEFRQVYISNLKEKNINGKVLTCCSLDELKSELQMTFGDWQLFKNWILAQRLIQIKHLPNSENKIKNSIKTKSAENEAHSLTRQYTKNENVNHQNLSLTKNETVEKLKIKKAEDEQSQSIKPNPLNLNMSAAQSNETTRQASALKSHPSSPNTYHVSGRKVEFFITPVLELNESKSNASNEKTYKDQNDVENRKHAVSTDLNRSIESDDQPETNEDSQTSHTSTEELDNENKRILEKKPTQTTILSNPDENLSSRDINNKEKNSKDNERTESKTGRLEYWSLKSL
jgi:hypothetical protein